MTTIITRLYASPEKGAAAVSALKAKKFKDGDIDCIAGGDGAAAALAAAGVYESAAQTYAAKLKDGGAVVVVRAPFGNAVRAGRVLDAEGPEASPVKHDEVYVASTTKPMWTGQRYLPELLPEGTLMASEMLMPRAILEGGWTFSGTFGMPMLSSRKEPRAKLSTKSFPFSGALGLPLLSGRVPRSRLITSGPRAGLINK